MQLALSTVEHKNLYAGSRPRGGLRTRLRKTTDSQVLVWHSSRVATSFVFLGWRRPTWLYHFLRASHHQSVNLRVQPSHAPCVQCRRRTCSALNLTRPIVSFSAIEIYWESESKPTYSASESRCWFTAHSLRSRQATNELSVLAEGGQAGNGSGGSASVLFGGVRVAGAHILGLQVLQLRVLRVPFLRCHPGDRVRCVWRTPLSRTLSHSHGFCCSNLPGEVKVCN